MAFKDDAFDFQTPDWFRRRTEDQDGWFLQFWAAQITAGDRRESKDRREVGVENEVGAFIS